MSVIRGARERARAEVGAAIKEEAGRQLAAEGAAQLSLRAVARELGLAPSAVYRYFPNRDDLLTALIVGAYDALGAAAETALADAGTADPLRSWMAVCRAIRDWALARPHEYALIYGSPVPGYDAPPDTVGPASRVPLALVGVVEAAAAAGALASFPGSGQQAEGVSADARRLFQDPGRAIPLTAAVRLVAVWAQLFGLISFEVFGRFDRIIDARDDVFDRAVLDLAHQAGLRPTGTGSAAESAAGQ
ncbi:TetR/AcrR family transcriptional regulator [Streptomyces sp. NBC_01320]|uniref:TetR/AcrR family transcriptional regulator n=1 Tax=Streptomyces sp. NBC_01320 TaxID=2903824 RepID=UPI002E0FADCF|nr:TetR/AcrR family transcriptional regulator [Streptomyces sp. NBC_01320]